MSLVSYLTAPPRILQTYIWTCAHTRIYLWFMSVSKRKRKRHRGGKRRQEPYVPALGFSTVQATASGAGTHGGSKRARNRRSRAQAKRRLTASDPADL